MLALIAGQGRLPVILRDRITGPMIVGALEGFSPDIPVDLYFRVEQLGSFLKALQREGVTRVCFAGSIARPSLDPTAVDEATLPLVERIVGALHDGDDGALREVLKIFEETGFEICAAHELVPELLLNSGVPTRAVPTVQDERDAERGFQIMAATAVADIGQGCVVSHGQALAVETLGGTDWMLASIARDRPPAAAPGGVFVKAPKPNQDRRVDLPVIGPQTIKAVAAAGLNGVVIEAGGVMVLSAQETLRVADENEVFIWVKEVT